MWQDRRYGGCSRKRRVKFWPPRLAIQIRGPGAWQAAGPEGAPRECSGKAEIRPDDLLNQTETQLEPLNLPVGWDHTHALFGTVGCCRPTDGGGTKRLLGSRPWSKQITAHRDGVLSLASLSGRCASSHGGECVDLPNVWTGQ